MVDITIVLSKINESRLSAKFIGRDRIPWVYLGKDFLCMKNFERRLGSRFERINIARLQDNVAGDIRRTHVEWIDKLNRINADSTEWWFGAISSRNVHISNLFQYCCYLDIVVRLLEKGSAQPELIVVESRALAKTILKSIKQDSINILFVDSYLARLRDLLFVPRCFLVSLDFIVQLICRKMAAYISRREYGKKNLGVNPSVIVGTFMHDECINEEGIFHDRYYPMLHEYYQKKGIYSIVNPIFAGFRYNYLSIYKKMRKSKTLFIIAEDFLKPLDYFAVLIYPFRAMFRKIRSVPFMGVDLSEIIEEEQKQQFPSTGMQAVLLYRLFGRLAKIALKPIAVVNWHENQVIDKALIIGCRKAFPDAKLIGAQIFLRPSNQLSLFLCQSEIDAGVAPDELLLTSKYQCQLAQVFTDKIPCFPVAALRYNHVFNENPKEMSLNTIENKVILILPSFDLPRAVELVKIFTETIEEIPAEVKIFIKCHPDYNGGHLINNFKAKSWPNRFKIFSGSLCEALKLSTVVISSDSGSLVEAAVRGIPAIFMSNQLAFSQNYMDGIKTGNVTKCFSVFELRSALKKYLYLSNSQLNQYRMEGKRMIELFFTPVNDITMEPFLGAHSLY